MSRFRIDHLVDEFMVADCGFDPFVGFFVEISDVRRKRPHLIYDRLQINYDHERPLLGALQFLEDDGFLNCLEESLGELDNPEPESLPSGVRRSIDVVMQFKRAAD